VHAFATDPKRGIFILAFLAIVAGSSLALFAWRAPKIGLGGRFEVVSRESMLLVNNVVLSVAAGTVMLGTLYPLFLDALGLGKISVGPPYFEAVFVPLMVPAVFLMALGPIARWKEARLPELAWRLRWAGGAAVATAILLPLTLGSWRPLSALGFLLAGWVIAASVTAFVQRLRMQPAAQSFGQKLRAVSGAQLGMLVAHAGIGIFIIGVTAVKAFETEQDLRMRPGEVASVGSYALRFDGVRDREGPNYSAARGTLQLLRDGKPVRTLHPEKRVYHAQNQPMTESAIDSGLTRDLYVALGEPLEGGAWSVRIHYKPLVVWIWLGCVVMAIGGLLATLDRRYRVVTRRREAPRRTGAVGSRAA